MYDFQTHLELGGGESEGSGSWGWTSNGREFIAIGQTTGTAFAEVTADGQLEYLGRLPANNDSVIWRELSTVGNTLVVGSEGIGHGLQFFDLRKILDLSSAEPKTFDKDADVAWLNIEQGIHGRSHTVRTNEELNYAVALGCGGRAGRNDTCAGGPMFINLQDPENPFIEGCAPQDGYTHDAQCIVYRGPDTRYWERDICYAYNEDTLTIYDVTNKQGIGADAQAKVISRTPYTGASYTHQGWVIDTNWQTHIVVDDELDEGQIDPNRTAPDSPAKDGFPSPTSSTSRTLSSPSLLGTTSLPPAPSTTTSLFTTVFHTSPTTKLVFASSTSAPFPASLTAPRWRKSPTLMFTLVTMPSRVAVMLFGTMELGLTGLLRADTLSSTPLTAAHSLSSPCCPVARARGWSRASTTDGLCTRAQDGSFTRILFVMY